MRDQPSENSGEDGATDGSLLLVKAWDLPTRLFHWSLVALMIMAYVTRHYVADFRWHKWTGYAILMLVVFRLLWGFAGSSTARFGSFAYSPLTAARYGVDFLLRRPRHFLGHNPLGGTVVLVLLAMIAAQAVTGLFAYDDHTSLDGGPLASRISEPMVAELTKWHIRLFNAILVVVALHILANFLYLVWRRENLIRPMLTGKKPKADYEDGHEASWASPGRALLCFALAVVIVIGGITLAGGRIL